jgi:hypothetical protein
MTITTKSRLREPADPEILTECSKCSGTTAHLALATVSVHGSEGDSNYSFDWQVDHQLIQCLGCKSITYRTVSSNSEDYGDDEDGSTYYRETEKLYPPRVANARGLGDEAAFLPQKIRQIYEETLVAFSASAPVLAAIGLRALIEVVCKEKAAEGNDLFRKIDSLVEKGVLTPAGAAILHKIRTLGNAAAHEIKPHSEAQLGLAIDIVEHLLKDVFILPKKVETEFADDDA